MRDNNLISGYQFTNKLLNMWRVLDEPIVLEILNEN